MKISFVPTSATWLIRKKKVTTKNDNGTFIVSDGQLHVVFELCTASIMQKFMFGQGPTNSVGSWSKELKDYRARQQLRCVIIGLLEHLGLIFIFNTLPAFVVQGAGQARRSELAKDTALYAEGAHTPEWVKRQGQFNPVLNKYKSSELEQKFVASEQAAIAARGGDNQPPISNETPAWFLGRRASPVRTSQLAFDQRPIRALPAHVKELQEGGKGNKRRHVAGIMRALWEPESRKEKSVPHEVITTTSDHVNGQVAADPPVHRWQRRTNHDHRHAQNKVAAESPDWIIGAVPNGGGTGAGAAAAAAAAAPSDCGVRSSAFSTADLHWKCGHETERGQGPRWQVAASQEFKQQGLSQLQSTDAPEWMSANAARRQRARDAAAADAAATARGQGSRPSAEAILAGLRPPPDPHRGRDRGRERLRAGARTRARQGVVAPPERAPRTGMRATFSTQYGTINDSTVSGDAPAFFVEASRRICPANVRELPTDSSGTFRAHRGRRLLQEVLDQAAKDFKDEPGAGQHLFQDHFKPRYRGRGKRASDLYYEGEIGDGAYNIVTNADRDLAGEAAARRAAHARVRGPPRTYRQRDASPSPVKAAGAALVGSNAAERAVMDKLARDRRDTDNAEFGLMAETSERFDSMREAFLSIDRDGDGRVGWTELAEMCRRWNLPKEQVEGTLERCDEDGDGLVSFAEFSSKFGSGGYTEQRAF